VHTSSDPEATTATVPAQAPAPTGPAPSANIIASPAAQRRAATNEALVERLAARMSYAAAGRAVGMCERTVRRRMAEAEFANRVEERRRQRLAAYRDHVGEVALAAVAALEAGLESPSERVRLRAAQAVLNTAGLTGSRR
jgi:hypothetical protein